MARRKKSAKKTSHRRRRVSGVALSAKSPLVQYGAIAAGYLMADTINTAIEKVVPATLDPKLVAAAQVLGGFLLKSKMKGAGGAIAGGLLMGSGAKKGLHEFGVINGLPTVSGYKDLRTINGLPVLPQRRVAGPVGDGISQSASVISGVDSYSSYTDHD